MEEVYTIDEILGAFGITLKDIDDTPKSDVRKLLADKGIHDYGLYTRCSNGYYHQTIEWTDGAGKKHEVKLTESV